MAQAPSACGDCLSRGILLGRLAAHIDKAVSSRAGDRARDVLALGDEDLAIAMAPSEASKVIAESRSEAAQSLLLSRLASEGCWSSCVHSGPYPDTLEILGAGAPRALFGAGNPDRLRGGRTEVVVTLVGSRRAGRYGLEVAESLARDLAAAGATVVSGLALGIDSAVHEGALAGAGETVAVLGTGPERPYPRSRRGLYSRIRESGAIVSELPPGSPTFRWMFPARNRLMAAMAGLTVVVEAKERSGSLITAEMALDLGRPVGAVPGPINSWRSSGANRLLAEGALVVRGAADILDSLLGPGTLPLMPRNGPPLDIGMAIALDAVEAGAGIVDEIAAVVGLGYARTLAALSRLERAGYLQSGVSGRYSRTSQVAPPAPEHGPRR